MSQCVQNKMQRSIPINPIQSITCCLLVAAVSGLPLDVAPFCIFFSSLVLPKNEWRFFFTLLLERQDQDNRLEWLHGDNKVTARLL